MQQDSCRTPTLSSTQVGTPSKTEAANAQTHALAQQLGQSVFSTTLAHDSGAVQEGNKGPGGQNTQNVAPSDAGNPNGPSNGVQQAAPIYGTAQESSKTPTPASTSMRIADEQAQDPDTERVHLNQTLRTVTGDPNAPLQRPDITVVRKDGSVDMHEVVSLGQTSESQELKLQGLRPQLARAGSNVVVSPDTISPGTSTIMRGAGVFGVLQLIFHEYVNQVVEQRRAQSARENGEYYCAADKNCS